MMPLRWTLKKETQASHDRLDAIMSQADIASRTGFAFFLETNRLAYATLISQNIRTTMASLLTDLSDRCHADLESLGFQPEPLRPAECEIIDPIALDYVIGGTAFGSEVLQRRWEDTSDSSVRAAAAYFSAPSRMPVWQGFLSDAAGISVESKRAKQVVTDANRAFDVFLSAASFARQESDLIHARS